MSSRTRIISDEVLDRARALRAEGKSWGAIGREVGFDRDVIRWRIDPDFVAHRKAQVDGPPSNIVRDRVTDAEIERIRSEIPPDTRSRLSRFMGDPLPGRSALDLRRRFASQTALPFSPVRAERGYDQRGFAERAH